MEIVIGNILRWGVIVAAAVGLVGMVMLVAAGGSAPEGFRHFSADAATGLPAILAGVARGNGRGVMEFGLALLLLTPIVRVALSLIAFARERDRTYVILTAVVLVLLLYGLAGGKV
jgi:uncharacterized membrane protein